MQQSLSGEINQVGLLLRIDANLGCILKYFCRFSSTKAQREIEKTKRQWMLRLFHHEWRPPAAQEKRARKNLSIDRKKTNRKKRPHTKEASLCHWFFRRSFFSVPRPTLYVYTDWCCWQEPDRTFLRRFIGWVENFLRVSAVECRKRRHNPGGPPTIRSQSVALFTLFTGSLQTSIAERLSGRFRFSHFTALPIIA